MAILEPKRLNKRHLSPLSASEVKVNEAKLAISESLQNGYDFGSAIDLIMNEMWPLASQVQIQPLFNVIDRWQLVTQLELPET